MLPEKLQMARILICNVRPYLTTAVWSMFPVEKPGIKTMAVDKHWRLYYDPQFVEDRDVSELAAVLYHEVSHLLRKHNQRGVGKTAQISWPAECVPDDLNPTKEQSGFVMIPLWLLATDFEINDDIHRECRSQTIKKIHLWDKCILPSQFDLPEGLLAEEYYEMMIQKARENSDGGGKKKKKGQQYLEIMDCGSGCCGDPRPYEEPDGNPDVPSVSDARAEVIRHETAKRIKSIGNAPGSWERWADQVLNPKVNWRVELARVFARESDRIVRGKSDYWFRRPSRRRNDGVFSPSMIDYLPRTGVVIDTSGSMSEKDLADCLAELSGILREVEDVSVYSVDTRVASRQEVHNWKHVRLKGGGGTDMRVGICAADSDRQDIIVVLTDGETPWDDVKTVRCRSVIAVIINNDNAPDPPKWIRTVRVS